jgi:hypothetical protein
MVELRLLDVTLQFSDPGGMLGSGFASRVRPSGGRDRTTNKL